VAKQLLSFQIHVKPNALDKNLRSVQVALGGEYSILGELVHSTNLRRCAFPMVAHKKHVTD
jgi:hypothetical protein